MGIGIILTGSLNKDICLLGLALAKTPNSVVKCSIGSSIEKCIQLLRGQLSINDELYILGGRQNIGHNNCYCLQSIKDLPGNYSANVPRENNDKAINIILGAADWAKRYNEPKELERVIQAAAMDHPQFTAFDKARGLAFKAGTNFYLDGSSESIRELHRQILLAAESVGCPVLVFGESGSGKERVARMLHKISCLQGQLKAINCAEFANQSHLAHSRLFGHVKGAYTHASTSRTGLIREAAKGTLFLDELGLLPMEEQGRLLRVLQEKKASALGTEQEYDTEVRVIAATNDDIVGQMKSGGFRKDLFFRISTIILTIPPLRKRQEDIPVVVQSICNELAEKYGFSCGDQLFSKLDVDCLKTGYDWPGNTRELHAIIERACALNMTSDIQKLITEQKQYTEFMENVEKCELPDKIEKIKPLDDFTKIYARQAFELCGRNKQQTVRRLGISRNTLNRYLADY